MLRPAHQRLTNHSSPDTAPIHLLITPNQGHSPYTHDNIISHKLGTGSWVDYIATLTICRAIRGRKYHWERSDIIIELIKCNLSVLSFNNAITKFLKLDYIWNIEYGYHVYIADFVKSITTTKIKFNTILSAYLGRSLRHLVSGHNNFCGNLVLKNYIAQVQLQFPRKKLYPTRSYHDHQEHHQVLEQLLQ